MAIDPFFLQKPKELNLNTDIKTKEFKIVSISQKGDYTLCRWSFGGEHKISGEILYFNKVLIKAGGGALYDLEENNGDKGLNFLSNFQNKPLNFTIKDRFKNTDIPRSILESLYNEDNFIRLD